MPDAALDKDGDVGRASANVGEHDPHLPFGVFQDRLARGQGLQDQVIDLYAGGAHALDKVAHRGRGAGDNVRLDLQADALHADGVLDAFLAIDHISARDGVDNLLVVRDGNGPRRIEGAIDVELADAAGAARDADDAPAVDGTDVPAAHTHIGTGDLVARDPFRLLHRGRDGLRGFVDVDHDPLAQTTRRSHAHAYDAQLAILVQLAHQRADFGCPYVDSDNGSRFSHLSPLGPLRDLPDIPAASAG